MVSVWPCHDSIFPHTTVQHSPHTSCLESAEILQNFPSIFQQWIWGKGQELLVCIQHWKSPWAAVFQSEEEALPGPPSSYRLWAVSQQQPAHTPPNRPQGQCLIWIPWGYPICIICPVFFDMVRIAESRELGLRNTVTHLKTWEG